MLPDVDPQIAAIVASNPEDVPPNDQVPNETVTDPDVDALVEAT